MLYGRPDDVPRLCSFFVLVEFVFDRFAFIQGFKPIRLNNGEVHEDVCWNFGIHNKPEAFLLVKPFDCTFSHTLDRLSQAITY